MTTENQPAEQAAATDETASAREAGEQSPAARSPSDPVDRQKSEGTVPEVQEAAGQDSGEGGDGQSTAAESAGTDKDSPLPEAARPSEDTPSSTPRKVRLNPTVTPGVARPIPSLRSTESSPPVSQGTNAPAGGQGEDTRTEDTAETSAETQAQAAGDASEAATDATSVEAEESEVPRQSVQPVEIPGRNESLDADLEAELEAAMAGEEQQAAAASESTAADEAQQAAAAALTPDAELKRGAKLKGTVASIHGDDMFLDFGLRMAGVLSRRQFGLRKQPMQGESLEVVVGRIDEKEGLIQVNLPTGTSRVRGEWEALSVDQNVECMVTGTNKGGLEVSIGAIRGFMPASQVELGFVPDLNVYVGQKLKARIAEVNPKRRKLVLTRRALLEEEREQSQQELFEKIEPGQQYTGRVRTLKDYGAFVDIGGADGLLHVAQISWSRINHPSEVLSEGEEIQVQVLSVDKDKKKISLGMRQLTQNPWKSAESKFTQGTQVHGKVTRIENFGAFVELAEGVEGLVHISELDHKRVNKVGDVLRVGQEVDVQVLEVDPKRKRVSLSLKALKEKPEDPREKAESAPIKRQRSVDSLVGGIGEPTGGQLFGDPNKFGG